jgi:hypothetical protein
MIRPITPNEVETKIPDAIMEAFNELIAKRWNGHQATVNLNELVALICDKMSLTNKQIIFDNHWLNVEDIYRKAGWIVKYDQPSYGDNVFEPYFIFRK